MAGFQCHEHDTAVRRIEQLGSSTDDVRQILMTHCDPDHAGGLADFPNAKVHMAEEELVHCLSGHWRYISGHFEDYHDITELLEFATPDSLRSSKWRAGSTDLLRNELYRGSQSRVEFALHDFSLDFSGFSLDFMGQHRLTIGEYHNEIFICQALGDGPSRIFIGDLLSVLDHWLIGPMDISVSIH